MEREKDSHEGKEWTLNDAITYVTAKDLETRTTGRIDEEPSMFAVIADDLTKGFITPKEAVDKVDALIAGRQDYN